MGAAVSLMLAQMCQADAAATGATPSACAPAAPPIQVLISVPDQRLAVVCNGELVARYPVSTSRFGTGDSFYSYRTPLGELRVCDKIGENLPPGAVIRHRAPTGEVLPVNAPGRDPIVTRVVWLDGLEPQNRDARTRGIYIHGTPQEWTIGKPMSWGCIRMRSRDVIKFFDEIPVGTVVSIIPQKLPHMHKYEPPKEQPAPGNPGTPPAPSPAPKKLERAQDGPSEIARGGVINSPAKGAIAEAPAKEDTAALHAMKGSILLANLPSAEREKERRGVKAGPATQ